MERLYVLYDERCGFCRWARRWASSQPAIIPLTFVAADTERSRRMFPGLEAPGAPEELVLVSDDGDVYRGNSAWIMCLFALENYREWANRLASPLLRPLARRAFALLSEQRGRLSWWIGLADDEAVVAKLRGVSASSCELGPAASGLHLIQAETGPKDDPPPPDTDPRRFQLS